MILVAFLKTLQLALLPLLLVVMFLRFNLVEVHSYTISENWSHRLYMLLKQTSFGIFYDFILDILSYLFY